VVGGAANAPAFTYSSVWIHSWNHRMRDL
jgi:hypothetical protein